MLVDVLFLWFVVSIVAEGVAVIVRAPLWAVKYGAVSGLLALLSLSVFVAMH